MGMGFKESGKSLINLNSGEDYARTNHNRIYMQLQQSVMYQQCSESNSNNQNLQKWAEKELDMLKKEFV